MFDPYVAIMDAKRFELASSDDAALDLAGRRSPRSSPRRTARTSSRSARAPTPGNGTCLYRLHVGNFPRPTATVPAGGKLGETVDVRWIGDVAGEKTTKVTLPGEVRDATSASFAQDEKGIAPYPNAFRLSPFGNVIEAEPNDDQAHGHAVRRRRWPSTA